MKKRKIPNANVTITAPIRMATTHRNWPIEALAETRVLSWIIELDTFRFDFQVCGEHSDSKDDAEDGVERQ